MPPQDPLISRNIPSSPPRDGYSTMEKVDPHEPIRRPSVLRRRSFLVEFSTSKGPPQIVAIVLLVALGAGATIGIGPAIMTDRFARLNHGYHGEDCSDFVNFEDKPEEMVNWLYFEIRYSLFDILHSTSPAPPVANQIIAFPSSSFS